MGSHYQTGLLFLLATAVISFVVYLTAIATIHNHKISPPPFNKVQPFHPLNECMPSNPPPTPSKKVQPVHLPIKSILYWTTTFGKRNNEKLHELDCSPFKCLFTGDGKGKPEDFDALIFHTRDPQKPPVKRKPNQIYVAYTWESPTYRGGSFVKGNFYNWSWTYMTGSDIRFVHGTLLPGKAKLQTGDLPQLKTNTSAGNKVLWVVSNCRASSRRHLYINKLKQHIAVDIFGGCGKRCPRLEPGIDKVACYDHAAKSGKYKFYLAFENSACKDYISLKPFRALQAGLVPIVFGGLNAVEYYNGILPPNSFIDATNFNSPQHLAEFLQILAKDEARYLAYHAWRENTKVGGADPHMCAVCRKLYDEQYRARPRQLDWGKFWDPAKLCDNKLVDRLMGR